MEATIDMLVSPHDRKPAPGAALDSSLVQLSYSPRQRWVPSRYNARAIGDDGRLIVWNSFTGAISVFLEEDREEVIAHLSAKGVTGQDKYTKYLSKRGFLIRDTTDELAQFRYRYARDQWRTDTLQLILLASEDCNFRCVYCYEKFKHGTMSPEVRRGVKALVESRAPHLKELGISWFGGEPLYGWEAIEELGPFFKETVSRYGLTHRHSMTTNAYLLTEERATKLLDWGCRHYQITVDGLPEEHDCKRVGRDGSPTYHVILDNLRSLRERRDESFQVDLRVNFDQDNFPKLGAFLEALSEDFGGDPRFKMRFRAVGKWGGPNDDALATCGVEEKREASRKLQQKAAEVNLGQEGGVRNMAEFGSNVCYAARPYNFIVSATGMLMKCTIALDDLEDNVVGRLHSDGRLELNDERMSKWVNPYFETDSLCKTCYVLPGCQGVTCPLPRITQNTRSCSSVKSNLKHELRYTLAEAAKAREQRATSVAALSTA